MEQYLPDTHIILWFFQGNLRFTQGYLHNY